MSTFTESVLAFEFAPDTPAIVLSAFAPWVLHDPETVDRDEPVTDLSTNEASFNDDWESLVEDAMYTVDGGLELRRVVSSLSVEDLARVWRGWFGGVGDVAYFAGHASTTMMCRYGGRWALTARTFHKEMPHVVAAIIAPLGRYADHDEEHHEGDPRFVGYLKYEYVPFPNLIWQVRRDHLRIDDLDKASEFY